MAGKRNKKKVAKAAKAEEEIGTTEVADIDTPPGDCKQSVLVMAQPAEDMGEVSARYDKDS
jgi:hypothetical protein